MKRGSWNMLLALCVLTLSDSNEDPERVFSINAAFLKLHGSTMKDETIVALILVKDFIIRFGGVENVEIYRELLGFCSQTCSLLGKKTSTRWSKTIIWKTGDGSWWKRRSLCSVPRDFEIIKNGIQVAEEAITKGNEKISTLSRSKE